MPSLPDNQITVTFTRGDGKTFQGTSADTVTQSGLRVYAQIQQAGLMSTGALSLRIYGMTESVMNQLSLAAPAPQLISPNTVTIQAGDASSGSTLPTVYVGNLWKAFIDYSTAPDPSFLVSAASNSHINALSISPTSFKGTVQVSSIVQTIATKAGLQFQNHGVISVLTNPYYPGTADEQIERCALAARIGVKIDAGVVYIFPLGQGITSSVPIISPSTGLIGYPSYDPFGVELTTIFNPQLSYAEVFQLQSEYAPATWTNLYGTGANSPGANGMWVVNTVAHEIESQNPDGPWFTTLTATPDGAPMQAG